jgi:hypothetical protein
MTDFGRLYPNSIGYDLPILTSPSRFCQSLMHAANLLVIGDQLKVEHDGIDGESSAWQDAAAGRLLGMGNGDTSRLFMHACRDLPCLQNIRRLGMIGKRTKTGSRLYGSRANRENEPAMLDTEEAGAQTPLWSDPQGWERVLNAIEVSSTSGARIRVKVHGTRQGRTPACRSIGSSRRDNSGRLWLGTSGYRWCSR